MTGVAWLTVAYLALFVAFLFRRRTSLHHIRQAGEKKWVATLKIKRLGFSPRFEDRVTYDGIIWRRDNGSWNVDESSWLEDRFRAPNGDWGAPK